MKLFSYLVAIALLFLVTTPAAAQDAAELYKKSCASCHAADGSGDNPVGKRLKLRDLRSPEVQKQTDEQLFDIIAHGGPEKRPAHAYSKKGMDEKQIKALVAYIRTLKQ
jgi:mono/diheme cytochrome c family protein